MEASELKPCPLCGGECYESYLQYENMHAFQIKCGECSLIYGQEYKLTRELAEANAAFIRRQFNTRTPRLFPDDAEKPNFKSIDEIWEYCMRWCRDKSNQLANEQLAVVKYKAHCWRVFLNGKFIFAVEMYIKTRVSEKVIMRSYLAIRAIERGEIPAFT